MKKRRERGHFTRRRFLTTSALAGAGLLLPWRPGAKRALAALAGPQTALAGRAIPQFADELPLLGSAMVLATGTDLTIRMEEFKADVMPSTFVPAPTPADSAPAPYSGTWVWGYQTDGFPTPPAPNGALATYINPVIVATRGTPTKVTWVNNLPGTSLTETAWATWTDRTLHWADPLNEGHQMTNYVGPVPAVPHLHGGEVPPQLDGGPDAWFTPDGIHGHAYWAGVGGSGANTAVYNYPNLMEAAPTWFHDHALGITRINVYAGLAGAYLLLPGPDDDNWPLDGTKIIPLVIQDRMFDTNGQLYFPAGPPFSPNPDDHPFWVPEFEGDVICVNGKVWPRLTVSNKRYAFWFLNGSNARTYNMFLIDQVSKNFGPPIWVIGTDGGLLDTPVKLDPTLPAGNNSLTMMPGERYLAIINFAGYEAGVVGPNGAAYSGKWLLKNNAKTPFPAGVAPDGNTTGRVMQFVVNPASTLPDEAYNPALGGQLRTPMVRLVDPATGTPGAGVTVNKTRQLTLNEVMGPAGPLAALVNNSMWDGQRPEAIGGGIVNGGKIPPHATDPNTYYTEFPQEGETELWELVNLTADAHPIHLHLVQFQLMNRQVFNVNKYSGVYAAAFPAGVYIPEYGPPLAYDPSDNPQSGGKWGGNPDVGMLAKNGKPMWLQGPAMPPLPQEAGWKDTVIAYPGEVTRIMVRWAPTDLPANTPAADAWFPFDPNGGHGYVWHCHIIDHEDNEMMRPDSVIPNPHAPIPRDFVRGTDY